MRVAIVHDWLTGMRGGERVLEVLCDLYPEASLFTLVHDPQRISSRINGMDIRTSFVQKMPFALKRYRSYLPLFPLAAERFDLSGYELVISSSHCWAKSVRTPGSACHICYCYTPARYAWDLYDEYFGPHRMKWPSRMVKGALVRRFRAWDLRTSSRPDHFVAISENVARRIERNYGRKASVIHPPVATGFFTPGGPGEGEFYLVVSAFVPYKRVDLAVRAFNELGLPLVVVGSGPDEARLRRAARENVVFAGEKSDAELRDLYRRARALVFPGEEDFGLVPLEAQSAGKPVIAYGRGGALETVVEGETGTFFGEQTPGALAECVRRYGRMSFDPSRIREHALSFGEKIFRERLTEFIRDKLAAGKQPEKPAGGPEARHGQGRAGRQPVA